MAQNEFDIWFTAQFGPPVFKNPEAEAKARTELYARRGQLEALEREMAAHLSYEARRAVRLAGETSNEVYGEKTRQVRSSSPTIVTRADLPTPNNRTYPQRVIGFLARSGAIHRKRQSWVNKLVNFKLHRYPK
jgi:hypothetical protein